MGEEVAAWRMRGEVVVAGGTRMGVEVGAFELKMGGEVGAFDLRMVGGAVGKSEKTGEVGEACGRMRGEGKEEAVARSSAVVGEAREKKTSEEAAVEEGTMTGEEGEAEGRRRWAVVEEAARFLLRHCRWPRRSTVSQSSSAVSGNPGTDSHCPVAATLHGVCPLMCRSSSCGH